MWSSTRLLVLGAIRILQPVHGYDVRRELVSWRLENHANLGPGSVYSAIRTLEKDRCVAVHSRAGGNSRPERTRYITTAEGDKEFQLGLREAWWTVREPSLPLIPALTLMVFMDRQELIRALQSRIARYEGDLESNAFTRSAIKPGATGADGEIPEHVVEIIDYITVHQRAEIDWARTLQKRLREGKYHFIGEPGFPAREPPS